MVSMNLLTYLGWTIWLIQRPVFKSRLQRFFKTLHNLTFCTIFAGMYGFYFQESFKAWNWQYYETYTVIQKNLLLYFLSIMIVEKIINITLKFCCRKKETTSRGRFGMLKSVLRNDTAFGYTERNIPKIKIHPGDSTRKSHNRNVDTYPIYPIGIAEKEANKPKCSFAMAMLQIHAISNCGDAGNLKQQITNLRRQSQTTDASPSQAMAFKN